MADVDGGDNSIAELERKLRELSGLHNKLVMEHEQIKRNFAQLAELTANTGEIISEAACKRLSVIETSLGQFSQQANRMYFDAKGGSAAEIFYRNVREIFSKYRKV